MQYAMKKKQHVVLLLDLAENNPFPLDRLRERIPVGEDVHWFRITEFGAQPSETGNVDGYWDRWTRAFTRMLAAARAHASGEQLVHYHLAGRAGLPMAAYAGLCLSNDAEVTVHNPRRRDNSFFSFPLTQSTMRPDPPFFTTDSAHPGIDGSGLLALCVGLGHPFRRDAIVDLLREGDATCAAIGELNTQPGSLAQFEPGDTAAITWQIASRLQALRAEYPAGRGLALFCAGPFALAAALGWAINPGIYGPLWLANQVGNSYQWAIQYPRGASRNRKPRLLVLFANPQNETRVDTESELQSLRDALGPAATPISLDVAPNFRAQDLIHRVDAHRPDIIHILCHGGANGDIAAVSDDGRRHSTRVSLGELLEALRLSKALPRLVVVHACHSSTIASALARDFDSTVGARAVLKQTTARAFTSRFYHALAQGASVRAAYEMAVHELQVTNVPGAQDIEIFHCPDGDQGAWTPFPRGFTATF